MLNDFHLEIYISFLQPSTCSHHLKAPAMSYAPTFTAKSIHKPQQLIRIHVLLKGSAIMKSIFLTESHHFRGNLKFNKDILRNMK